MKKPQILSRVGKPNLISKLPLVELTGQSRVLIENHLGVLGYSLEEIQIKVSYGMLSVKGEQLKLIQMSNEQLVIKGHIDTLELLRR